MTIELAQSNSREAWDGYVIHHADSSFFQLYGWRRVFENSYRCETWYLMAREGVRITGILPLFLVRNRIFASYASSLPGGVCADDGEVADRLIRRAVEITKGEHARYLKIRDGSKRWSYGGGNLEDRIETTFVADLPSDPGRIWQKVKANARTPVRKAVKSGLRIERGRDYLERLYPVYAANMRDLGTPAWPLKFFQGAFNAFPQQMEILVAVLRMKVIGGMILFLHRDTVHTPVASSLRKYFEYCPNDLLYWEALKYACEKGFSKFDMGRSEKDSGVARFKEKWKAKSVVLHYQYYLNGIKKAPCVRSDRKFSLASNVWRRLPLWVTNSPRGSGAVGPSFTPQITTAAPPTP